MFIDCYHEIQSWDVWDDMNLCEFVICVSLFRFLIAVATVYLNIIGNNLFDVSHCTLAVPNEFFRSKWKRKKKRMNLGCQKLSGIIRHLAAHTWDALWGGREQG